MTKNELTYADGERERQFLAMANSELRSDNLILQQEVERRRAVHAAIAALHQPISNPYDGEPNSLCGDDLQQWPCATHCLLHPEEARREQ